MGALIALCLLGVGALGLGHDHAWEGDGSESHCRVACHLQAHTLLPTGSPIVEPLDAFFGVAPGFDPGLVVAGASVLRPPLRGPPVF